LRQTNLDRRNTFALTRQYATGYCQSQIDATFLLLMIHTLIHVHPPYVRFHCAVLKIFQLVSKGQLLRKKCSCLRAWQQNCLSQSCWVISMLLGVRFDIICNELKAGVTARRLLVLWCCGVRQRMLQYWSFELGASSNG